MTTLIILIALGILLFSAPSIIWNIKYGSKYIEVSLLPLRRKYRIISVFGLVLLLVTTFTLMEMLQLIEDSITWCLISSIALSNNKRFFEPYFTTEVVDQLENFSLYLRPFTSDSKGSIGWLNGTLEKTLCGEFNKYIAKCYCIGDPNSAIPTTLSASCIYASDIEWQNAVRSLSEKSKVILIRVMKTEGCIWELRNCTEKHLDKTIFFIDDTKNIRLLEGIIPEETISSLSQTNIEKRIIALYFNSNDNHWQVTIIKNKRGIRNFIKDYIKAHDKLGTDIKKRKSFSYLIKKPFRQKDIPHKWIHYLMFMIITPWYILHNRWPKFWTATAIINYILSISLAIVLSINSNNPYLVYITYILSLIPLSLIAPLITTAFNNTGSKLLTHRSNVVLGKWGLIYMLLSFLLTFCTPISDTMEDASKFAEHILTEEYGYSNLVTLETSVDSAFNSVYTNEKALECINRLMKAVETDEVEKQSEAVKDFYNTVDSIDGSGFYGWYIIHRFSHCDDDGKTMENTCLIIIEKNLESYFVYALDDNEQFMNFNNIKTIVEDLIIGIETVDTKPVINEKDASNTAKYILEAGYGYKNIVTLETSVDSAFNSVYTNMNALECIDRLMRAVETEEVEKQDEAVKDFYNIVDSIDGSVFYGWYIIHRFSHCDDDGKTMENTCLIIIEKNLESYFVYALDDNLNHPNIYETEKIVLELLSE